jgi:hypothetical protein
MPLYFGHKNTKGLAVSPALQSLKIDLLRAPPSAVSVIARPTVTQPGYSAYVNHLSAFMKATNEKTVVHLIHQGYTTNFPIAKCLPVSVPPLVIDYGTTPPAKFVEELGTIGFERIRIQKNENILRFPAPSINQIRKIKETNPNTKTPCPAGAMNLDALDTWILSLRVISNLLTTHVYPAFRDTGHMMEEIETMVSELMTQKREAPETLESGKTKQLKTNQGEAVATVTGEEEEDVSMEEQPQTTEVILRKAKPSASTILPWGTASEIPNASGLFFPFIPELASYDGDTIPRLFEDYLLQSLGNTPEQQLDRYSRIKSAWGIISKTDTGNVMAHLGKVILLSLTSQGRCFPIVQDGIYQGSVLSGGRLFVGLNGQIHRPLDFDKLQEETGSYHLHSRVLNQIAEIVNGGELDKDANETAQKVIATKTIRHLRNVLLEAEISESDRDEIRKLAVHLHFKNDNHLSVNPQSISRILTLMSVTEDREDARLPMHHSALFSRDKVYVSLAAFGFQAPSFNVENCPKVNLKDSKPPTTLVVRQKPLDIATLDWKRMIEEKEIRNNPRNLSRANRDRTITANDKTMIWGKLKEMCGAMVLPDEKREEVGFVVDTNDGLDDW